MEQSENPSWRLVKHKKIINIYFQKFNCHIISANLVLFLILCKTHTACSRDIAAIIVAERACHAVSWNMGSLGILWLSGPQVRE